MMRRRALQDLPPGLFHLLIVGASDRSSGLAAALTAHGYCVTTRPADRAQRLLTSLWFDAIVAVDTAVKGAEGCPVIHCAFDSSLPNILQNLRIKLLRAFGGAPPVLAVGRGDIWFDVETLGLKVGDQPANLTRIEARLLRTLALNPFVPVCRTVLRPGAPSRAVDISIMRLRRRLEPDPDEPVFVRTVRNRGYMLTPELMVHADH